MRSNARYFCYQLTYFCKNLSVCVAKRRSGVFVRHNKCRYHLLWILSHQVRNRIISFISALMSVHMPRLQTCWTGNKSDHGVRGVMFNNKKYYLPRSMYVAIAIKYNEWKGLETCSKFWCAVILNTLWQHTARQGCKTSSNRLLNIRLLHSCTPWVPYIKAAPQHAKAKRDDMARSKIGQRDIFISGEWVCVSMCVN